MKKNYVLLTFFLLFTILIQAQASFTSAGIAVQGIVRDDGNTAIQDQTVNLEFEFYYYETSGAIVTIGSIITKDVVTDNFGVFSTIIDPNFANNQVFSNTKVWLRIRKTGDTPYLSEAPLSHVPYAISANNGVPTGTIMPFIGDTAPMGWLLCDGSVIPNGALKTMLTNLGLSSSVTPDLQGRFLKGVGTDVESRVVPIGLGDKQTQSTYLKTHKHGVGTLVTNNISALDNTDKEVVISSSWRDVVHNNGETDGEGHGLPRRESGQSVVGDDTRHQHTISGSVADTDADTAEVRPSSFGVNYIIKL